jgi:hypothetical protein
MFEQQECIVLTRQSTVVKRNIRSVTYKNKIIVKQIDSKETAYAVTLSVSRVSHHQLIVGNLNQKNIHVIYGANYNFITTLRLPIADTGGLMDAVWTPDGNIVYATFKNSDEFSRVVTMSQSSDVIALYNTTNAAQLSVSANNVVYLADATRGIYQSLDGGLTWSFMFTLTDGVIENPAKGWYMRQALEVSKDHTFVHLWTVEVDTSSTKRFQIYKILSKNNVTEIAETFSITAPFELITASTNSIEYDGLETIMLTCIGSGDVYLFDAVSGAYLRSVNVVSASVSYVGIDNYPVRLAIDRRADGQVLLYVYHQNNGIVSIHTLTYE